MRLKVRLHPGSSQEKVESVEGGYEIWIKEKPIDGKANVVLVKLLKRFLKCRGVEIVSGFKSRNKIVEIK